jgi:predicted dehydrogenase/nucleoside-diphosphate-sugar epimerase
MSRICLVGAGFISRVHADALKVLGHRVTAVVDPNEAAGQRLAAVAGAAYFPDVQAALAADAFDRAHVLVPPDLHGLIAGELLRAGKPVLLEKPMAASGADCETLLAAEADSGAALGINQNFVHHPAFVRLRQVLDAGTLGRPRHVSCLYNVPLRQMAARQFGHWMFQSPGNILLEQAVHPLSQIFSLAGAVKTVKAMAGPAMEIAPGLPFVATLDVLLACRDLPAQMRFAVGQSFPFWQITVTCDDGVAVADILANRMFTYRRTRWLEALDGMVSGLSTARAIACDAVRGMTGYAAGMLKLRPRGDAFFVSMRDSIGAFHRALDAGEKPALGGRFGAGLVAVCETIRDQVFPVATPRPAKITDDAPADVAVLGGTGFIGTHLVRQLTEAGLHVAVMARNLRNLPAVFDDPRVSLHRGDIGDAQAVARAIGSAPVVVNLAHGGASGGFEEIRRAMVGGAETVARVCQEKGVRRLVHVGSIASLYLGPQDQTVTGATPPDAREKERGDYARAKVLCDRMLLAMHAAENLPVVILRPGVVVGEGSSPFHSGVGLYNNEQDCIGWNEGRNPLPFVLAEDVAAAILLACRAEGIEGRCYNLAGDVRPSAREYVRDLGQALGRPLRYHPQSVRWLWLEDSGKWVVKRLTGRKVPAPAMRDFLSRGMKARLECADAVRELGWHPVADAQRFRARAIEVHAG